jgi:hypothetical protein
MRGGIMTNAMIARLAAEIARRFDKTMMRTEDRLNDEYLKRIIIEHATAVLRDYKERKMP